MSGKQFIYSTIEVRTRAVAAIQRGMGISQVAAAYGADRTTIFRWTKRYEKEGEVGLVRRPGSGRPRKLGDLIEKDFQEIILRPASHFGYETNLWTVARLRIVIYQEYGIILHAATF